MAEPFGFDMLFYYNMPYSMPISEIYNGHGFYYSPLWVGCFYPFSFFNLIGVVIAMLVLSIPLYVKMFQHLRWWGVLPILMAGWEFCLFVYHGNVEVWLLPVVVLLWYWKTGRNTLRGFLCGLLTFKLNLVLIFPFFYPRIPKESRKGFVLGFIAGVILNYIWLLFIPGWTEAFIANGLMPIHPEGVNYLIPHQYAWLWAVVVCWLKELWGKSHRHEFVYPILTDFEIGKKLIS